MTENTLHESIESVTSDWQYPKEAVLLSAWVRGYGYVDSRANEVHSEAALKLLSPMEHGSLDAAGKCELLSESSEAAWEMLAKVLLESAQRAPKEPQLRDQNWFADVCHMQERPGMILGDSWFRILTAQIDGYLFALERHFPARAAVERNRLSDFDEWIRARLQVGISWDRAFRVLFGECSLAVEKFSRYWIEFESSHSAEEQSDSSDP